MARKKRSEIDKLSRDMEDRRSRANVLEGQKRDLLERGEQLSRELDFEEQESSRMGLGFQDFDEKVKELEGEEKGAGEGGKAPSDVRGKPPEDKTPDKIPEQKPGPKKKAGPGPKSGAGHESDESEKLRRKLEEQGSLIDSLERDKASLAQVIEQISGQESRAQKNTDDSSEKLRSALEQRIRELEEKISSAGAAGKKEGESMAEEKKPGKSPEGGAEPEEKTEAKKEAAEAKADSKKISSMIRKAVDSRFDEISEKLKGLDRIAALAENTKSSAPPAGQPASSGQEEPSVLGAMAHTYLPHGGMEGSSVSTGLSAFGQEVNFQGEIIELKKQIDLLKKNLDSLSKKWDYSVGNLEERVRDLDKLPVLEKNFQELTEKLGSENVQRLKRLVFNADELTDEVIPDIINKKFRYRLDPVITGLKNTRGALKELNSRMNIMKSEMKELSRLRESINEFRLEKDRLYKRFAEEEAKFLDGLQVLKDNIKKKLDKMAEKMTKDMQSLRQASDYATIESNVKDIVTALFEKRFQELERNQTFFDQKAKGLSEDDTKLKRMIEEMEAPESIKRWTETRLQEIEKRIAPDIENTKKDISRHAEGLGKLREGLRAAEKVLNSFSKRADEHAAAITKLINSKDLFFKRADDLAGRMGILEEKASGE
jgi:DNA repair exonuclease SbcCD ATPase subunit